MPRVTVLMPVYNAENYLAEAIESILDQTFTDFEFLIIDDGSTDRSIEIVNSYKDHRILLVKNEYNLGLVTTLNQGLSLAKSKYIARMDADDISLSNRLQIQVGYMEAHPAIGVCGSWVTTIGDCPNHVWCYPTEHARIQTELLFTSRLAHPSVMMRRALLEKHGLFYDKDYLHAEDWQLWRRCSFKFPLANIPQVLLKYRINSSGVSHIYAAEQYETLIKIYVESLVDLKVLFSDWELLLHRDIAFCHSQKLPNNRDFLDRVDVWLQRLQAANSQSKRYPESIFSEVLAEHWFTICYFSTALGSWAWQRFWHSSLSRLATLSAQQKLKFALKCAIRLERK